MDADYSTRSAGLLADPMVEVAALKVKKIMEKAGKQKGFSPPLPETATTEAAATAPAVIDQMLESKYLQHYRIIGAAISAFHQIPFGGTGSSVLEFQRILGELPIDDLHIVEMILEGHIVMLPGTEEKAVPWQSLRTKFAEQAIGVMVTKVAGSAVFGAFEPPTDQDSLEKAAGALGLMSVIGGMMLQGTKPGLSKAMVKFGSVAIALAMIVPMAGNLEDLILSWIFGVLAAAIVAVTVTFT